MDSTHRYNVLQKQRLTPYEVRHLVVFLNLSTSGGHCPRVVTGTIISTII